MKVLLRLWDAFRRNPASVVGIAGAGIALAVSFGLHWTGPQVGAVMAVVNLMAAVLVRSQVSPDGVLGEPVLLTNLLAAGIALAVSFGLHWSEDQVGGAEAVVNLLVAFLSNALTTPTVSLPSTPAAPATPVPPPPPAPPAPPPAAA